MKNCINCKNAVTFIGAYTGTHYIECQLERERAENMTLEELKYAIAHPEEQKCEFVKGKPQNGGVTFDD